MITVIIPTYCEEANINVMLEKVRATLENLSLPYEVLVIDDSSKDETVAIAEDFFREFNCGKVIVRKKAPGLALSVIDGFKQSKGEIIIVMDADLSHPPESIPNLIEPLIEGKADFAIASRYITGGGIEGWPIKRRIISLVASMFGKLLFPNISDPASGFFALKREVVDGKCFDTKGFKIGMELVAKGNCKNIVEVPYVFTDRERGQSKLKINTVVHYLSQLLNILIYKVGRCMELKVIILFILLLIVMKTPALFNPLLGNYSTKQTIFATIARNFADDGEVLYPKIDYIIDGKKALHLLEVPYPAYLAGIVWKILGGSLDFWGRFVNFCFFLFSLIFLYLFSQRLSKDKDLSLIVCATFLLLPITSIYSVSFQMEGAMLFFLFGSLYYFFKWYGDAKFQFPFMWFIFSALLLLLKPHAVIYYLLPLGFLFLWKCRIKAFQQRQLYLMILPVIPVMLWVLHVKNVATADNNVVFYSLVDSVGAREFPPPLLFEVSFYKDIFDKLSGLLLTPLGFTLFLIGICTSYKSKNTGFVYIWGLFTLLYVFVLPRKMVDLSYYLLPVGCVGTFFIAFAIKDVVENKIFLHAFTKRTGKVFLGVTILIISFRYSFAPMFIIPEYDRHVVSAGKYIDENALRNSLVVASHGTSTDLLYYCNRTGWSFSVKREKLAQTFTPQELVYFKKKGKRIFNSPQEHLDYLINEHNASYFVCTPKRDLKANKGFFEYLQTNFSLLEETDGFIIYSLKK